VRNPFATHIAPARMHLSLRTLAANDNVPLAATAPPRHADGSASTCWPIIARIGQYGLAATMGAISTLGTALGGRGAKDPRLAALLAAGLKRSAWNSGA
jgi:hypothetical protein